MRSSILLVLTVLAGSYQCNLAFRVSSEKTPSRHRRSKLDASREWTSDLHTDTTVQTTDDAVEETRSTTEDPLASQGISGTLPQSNSSSINTMLDPALGTVSNNQLFHTWRYILWWGLYPIICLLGMLLNGLGLLLMFRMRIYYPFQFCLLALLIADELYLAGVLLGCIFKLIECFYEQFHAAVNAYSLFFYISFTNISFCTRLGIVLFMSMERCIKVVFPLKSIHIKMKRTTLATLLGLIVLNSAIFAPTYVIFRNEGFFVEDDNTTVNNGGWGDLGYPSMDYHDPYLTFVAVITRIVPFCTIVLCNVLICFQLLRHHMQRTFLFGIQLSRMTQQDQMRMTLSLISMSVLLTLPLLPSTLLLSFPSLHTQFDHHGRFNDNLTAIVVRDIGVLLHTVSASNDFIIYVYNSGTVRKRIRVMFTLKCRLHCASRDKDNDAGQ